MKSLFVIGNHWKFYRFERSIPSLFFSACLFGVTLVFRPGRPAPTKSGQPQPVKRWNNGFQPPRKIAKKWLHRITYLHSGIEPAFFFKFPHWRNLSFPPPPVLWSVLLFPLIVIRFSCPNPLRRQIDDRTIFLSRHGTILWPLEDPHASFLATASNPFRAAPKMFHWN